MSNYPSHFSYEQIAALEAQKQVGELQDYLRKAEEENEALKKKIDFLEKDKPPRTMKIEIREVAFFSIEFENENQLDKFVQDLHDAKIYPFKSTVDTIECFYCSGFIEIHETERVVLIINSIKNP